LVKFRLRNTIILGCFVLLVGAGWQWLSGRPVTSNAVEAQGILPDDVFQQDWKKPVSSYKSSALSPEANYAAVISGDNCTTTLYKITTAHGAVSSVTPCWGKKVDGVTRVAVTPNARNVILYTTWNPVKRDLTILKGSDGSMLSHTTLDGAIWDVSVSSDGCFASVVTGNHSLYLFTLGNQCVYHRWDLNGIGNTVAFTRNSAGVIAGTWDESGIACYSRTGDTQWQYPVRDDDRRALVNRLFEAHVADNGEYVLGMSYANIRQGDATLYLWRNDGTGEPLWTRPLGDDTFYPKAQITADGKFIAVSYLRLISRKDTSIQERRIMVLDDNNNVLWDKGGLLLAPVLVSLAPDGHRVTVSNGDKTLYHLSGNGHMTPATWTAPGFIRDTEASADGHFLLVYSGDGTLTLLKLTRGDGT